MRTTVVQNVKRQRSATEVVALGKVHGSRCKATPGCKGT